MKRFDKQVSMGGFAYLWLLIVIAMLGASSAITLEVTATMAQRQKEAQLLAIGQEFQNAIASYYSAHLNPGAELDQYPQSLDDLLLDHRFATTKRHLRKIYVDPITNSNEWGLVKVNGRIAGVYSLSEKKPIKISNFDTYHFQPQSLNKYSDWIFTFPPNLLNPH